MRILFMGTPEFAGPSLEALIAGSDAVVGVVCQPDRPAGRGQKLSPPPVKVIALRNHIPVLQPDKLRPAMPCPKALKAWNADCTCRPR